MGMNADSVIRSLPAAHEPATAGTGDPQRARNSTPVGSAAAAQHQRFDRYWATRELRSLDARTRLRIGIVEHMLTHASGSLLDVGCGRGATSAHFAQLGHAVTAIDISPQALEWTRRQHPSVRTHLVDLECDSLSGRFDAVVCLEVLQQVRNPVDVLSGLAGVTAAAGDLIVSLPNEFHLRRRLQILAGSVDFGGIDDTHIKLYNVAEHRRLFERCGLRAVASAQQSIIPPRWLDGGPHRAANALARMLPGLLALSVVYRLVPAVGTRTP
ncbi:MAG TPA: class I SAM-dependent methyltransferase [candidate division Zixibacteria bacterium]|jgi:2-polyprenyl-3-methyl-5-hydroxy-6-metoxy-1,4-benzoquinol methylase